MKQTKKTTKAVWQNRDKETEMMAKFEHQRAFLMWLCVSVPALQLHEAGGQTLRKFRKQENFRFLTRPIIIDCDKKK